jgi:hypothetical protein
MKTAKYNYVISARNSACETLFHTASGTQGYGMIPNAFSYAHRYPSRGDAREAMGVAKEKWKGLSDWEIERESKEDTAHVMGTRAALGDHGQG